MIGIPPEKSPSRPLAHRSGSAGFRHGTSYPVWEVCFRGLQTQNFSNCRSDSSLQPGVEVANALEDSGNAKRRHRNQRAVSERPVIRSHSCMPEPPRRIHVPLKNTVTLEAPGQSLRQGPQPGAFPVEPQRGRKLIQPAYYSRATVAELVRPNDWSYTELAFSNKRFRVDHEPRFARRS